MKTIYISKSKVGKHDDLMILREVLSTYDCEVTEFIGGKYSDEKLREADILIVLPHSPISNDIKVGRGQFDEIDKFDRYCKSDNMFIVTSVIDNEILLQEVEFWNEINSSDQNWTDNFGYVQTNNHVWELPELMYDRFKIPLTELDPVMKGKPNTLLATIGRRKT